MIKKGIKENDAIAYLRAKREEIDVSIPRHYLMGVDNSEVYFAFPVADAKILINQFETLVNQLKSAIHNTR